MEKTTDTIAKRYTLVSPRDAETKMWVYSDKFAGITQLVIDARPFKNSSIGKPFFFPFNNPEFFKWIIELEEEKDGEEIYYEVMRADGDQLVVILKPARKTELIFLAKNDTFTVCYDKNTLISTLVEIIT